MSARTTCYELPPEGITLLGYIVRRMHKTEWLSRASAALEAGQAARALEYAAAYAALSSTSFGRACYQPQFNRAGAVVSEADPLTGAIVTACLGSSSPHYHITCEVIMPNRDVFRGSETITGTTVGWRGLGMPAPSRFMFSSGEYSADFAGLLTGELALSLLGRTRIRAYGSLELRDSVGNRGRLDLGRTGDLAIRVNEQPVRHYSAARAAGSQTEASLQRTA